MSQPLPQRLVTAALNAMADNANVFEVTPAEVDAKDATMAVLRELAAELRQDKNQTVRLVAVALERVADEIDSPAPRGTSRQR